MMHLEGLNDRQKEAVTYIGGPLLVLAGAGSGKTRVITHRIVHLIEKGVAPSNILAVTFTNKAAREMRERANALIREYIPTRPASLDGMPTVTTFHSLGVRILRDHHQTLGLRKSFTIYDRSDSQKAIKAALEKAGYSPKQFEPRKILGIISRAKGNALTRLEFTDSTAGYIEGVAAEVWEHYEEMLAQNSALDFDDLLIKTLTLLQQHPPILEQYLERFRYIHIDEYQDTNKVQYELARLLSGDTHNICVVGDIDQNIYSWRGAEIGNILRFEKHFPRAKTILLEENYRSTKTIIQVSNEIIAKNKHRVEKTVFTNNHDGEPITLYAAYNETDEATFIANTTRELIASGVQPSEIAVLFRTNFQSRVLEEAFLKETIPYQVLGVRFFERKEVRDVLSFLRLALNPGNTADLSRVINTPPRGIGKVTLTKIVTGQRDALSGAIKEKVNAFDEMMIDVAKSIREKHASNTVKYVIERTGIEALLKKGSEEELERLENLRELVTLAMRYDEYAGEEGILRLLEDAALQSDQDELKNKKEDANTVKLMTIHAAKGLEFPYVFITGLEEGLFPHERLSDDGIDEEEERRLFYVALTRAGKKVFLTFAGTRTIFGSKRINVPSSFLHDIDDVFLESGNKTEQQHETVIEID